MLENSGFHGLGIAPGILQVLAKMGFSVPTPIQVQSIPIVIDGKDMMGIAQTGTGKTLAFGIPLIQKTLREKGIGLVVVPTRELAEQVSEALGKVGAPLGLKGVTLIGGESITHQIRTLARNPQIIIGTPGRIIDHLEQKTLRLGATHTLVLDEADRMLDMGFAPQLRKIIEHLPKERQTLLFSATMPEEIVRMARAYLKLPIRVEIARSGTTAKDVSQELFFVAQNEKARLLEKILQDYRGSVLLFSRTKHGAKKIARIVRALGHSSAELHSNKSLNQRREALEGFKTGKYRVLVATDIAARGIDVSTIELVINYDLPQSAEDYVHRIGRTGRAGEHGHAISFARPDQKADVYAIERLTRSSLPISALPVLPTLSPLHEAESRLPSLGFGGARPPSSRFRTPYGASRNPRPAGRQFNRERKGQGPARRRWK